MLTCGCLQAGQQSLLKYTRLEFERKDVHAHAQ